MCSSVSHRALRQRWSPSFTDKNKPPGGAVSASEKQTQQADASALTAAVAKLQQEKNQLQKEKAELEAKLAARGVTEGASRTRRMFAAKLS